MNELKELIKRNPAIYKIARFVMSIPRRIRGFVYREKHKRYIIWGGLDANYYVLRRISMSGIASDLLVFLGELEYMESHHKGYEPVVDMQNYAQAISETTGKSGNAWEDFFLQPNKNHVGMDVVKKSRNVILARCDKPTPECYKLPIQNNYEELVKFGWAELFNKYIMIKPDLERGFIADWERLRPAEGKVIGVKVRGTDYNAIKPGGHNIQPSADQVIFKVKDFMDNHREYDRMLIATEDNEIYKKFADEFHEKVLSVGNTRVDNYFGGAISDQKNVGNQSRKALTTQYLEEMYLLAKCDSLICSLTSSLAPTLLWNGGKYEEVYLFDLGKYD